MDRDGQVRVGVRARGLTWAGAFHGGYLLRVLMREGAWTGRRFWRSVMRDWECNGRNAKQ